MAKVEIYYTKPILRQSNSINISSYREQHYVNLKLIGEGSYASVFSFNDNFYNRKFVLKKAKKDLDSKELERFKQEFEEMKKLSSPYIVEVYRYEDDNNQYIMELMDYTLDTYYKRYNHTLSKVDRKSIANQILRAFKYIHSKKLLHRDGLSTVN
ncbi:MAG: protein kinase family protein [Eubacteriaceae bacterium]